MFGRRPKLPVDTMFEQAIETENKTVKEYIDDLKHRMKKTRDIVETHLESAKKHQKKNYDLKAKAAALEPGDSVLVKILAHDGKHKIADKYEDQIYKVVEQVNHLPVYKVKGSSSGNIRTLHRNHLFLLLNQDAQDETNDREDKEDSRVNAEETVTVVEINTDEKKRSDVTKEKLYESDSDDSEDDTEYLVWRSRTGDAQPSVPPQVEADDAVQDRVRISGDETAEDPHVGNEESEHTISEDTDNREPDEPEDVTEDVTEQRQHEEVDDELDDEHREDRKSVV